VTNGEIIIIINGGVLMNGKEVEIKIIMMIIGNILINVMSC
jgi:hypothetical protein